MTALETSGDTGTRVSASVENVLPVVVLGLVEQRLNAWLRETPGTCIKRLFLCPNDRLGIGVGVEVFLQLSPWEGVELLNAGNGSVGEVVGLAVLNQGSVDLTSAENDTLDFLLWLDLELGRLVCRVGNDPLEVGVTGEVLDA